MSALTASRANLRWRMAILDGQGHYYSTGAGRGSLGPKRKVKEVRLFKRPPSFMSPPTAAEYLACKRALS